MHLQLSSGPVQNSCHWNVRRRPGPVHAAAVPNSAGSSASIRCSDVDSFCPSATATSRNSHQHTSRHAVASAELMDLLPRSRRSSGSGRRRAERHPGLLPATCAGVSKGRPRLQAAEPGSPWLRSGGFANTSDRCKVSSLQAATALAIVIDLLMPELVSIPCSQCVDAMQVDCCGKRWTQRSGLPLLRRRIPAAASPSRRARLPRRQAAARAQVIVML